MGLKNVPPRTTKPINNNKPMTVTIPVKRHHITQCNMKSTHACVMALAMSEALPLADQVYVGIHSAHLFNMNGKVSDITLPAEVVEFIVTMANTYERDRGDITERNFEIDIPDEFVAKEPDRPVKQEVECVTS